MLFLQQLYSFTCPPTVHKGSKFSTSSPALVWFCFVLFFDVTIVMGVRWILIVVLICFS